MKAIGLFVDYETTYTALRKAAGTSPSHEQVGRHVLEVASSYGQVVTRIAWADWDRVPGAQRALARLGFDTRFVVANPGDVTAVTDLLETELLKTAAAPDAPDLFVVVGTSPSLVRCAGELRALGKEMVIVAREEAVPDALRGVAGLFESLPLPPSDAGSSRPQTHEASLGPEVSDESTMLPRIRAALVDMLSERRLPWVSFRLFSDYLVSSGVTTPDTVKYWIERAVARGYVRRERERGATRPFYKFTPGAGRAAGAEDAAESGGGSLFRVRDRSGPRGPRLEQRATSAFAWAGESVPAGRWNQDWRNFTFVRMLWALAEVAGPEQPMRPEAVNEALRKSGVGRTDEEIAFWINQAVDRGLLVKVRLPRRGAETPHHAYRIHLEHRLAASAEVVPVAIVHTIHTVLGRCTEWKGVAFNFLIRLLRIHPLLSNPADEYHVYRLREWINFLIADGVLAKFEEPDLKDPTRKTTMVTLNPEHPQTRRCLERAPMSPFFDPERQAVLRTILMIDHFLYWLHTKSPDEDWLPLMTLKSWLRNALGDQLTKWAVSACEEDRVFAIDRYQNKGGTEATVAGVRLSYQHPLVQDTLSKRDGFLKLLIRLLRDRASIPYRAIEKHLVDDRAFGDTVPERLGWFALMVDARVVTVDDQGTEFEDRGVGLLCRLNAREKFVGELVTRVIRGRSFDISREPGEGDRPGQDTV